MSKYSNNTKRMTENRTYAVNKLIRTNLDAECIIRIDHANHLLFKEDILSIINIYDFMSFLAHDKDMNQEIKWAMQFNRRYPFWVDSYHGISGCIDSDIYYSSKPNWMRGYKKFWEKGGGIHVTSAEKLEYIYQKTDDYWYTRGKSSSLIC